MIDQYIIQEQVKQCLIEDIGSGDVTAELIPADANGLAQLICREPMVVCGIAWFNEVFRQVSPKITIDWLVSDGQSLPQDTCLCRVKGPTRSLLSAERVALNFLQTLSGVATVTRTYVSLLEGTGTQLLDTRKTIPGLRLAEKYAVTCGGGVNHRMGLYDAFLIKENHIKACGSIEKAIKKARQLNYQLPVILEVETIDELKQAFIHRPDRVLLDNFSLSALELAIHLNQEQGLILEVSGGIDEARLKHLARLGVNYISIGAITKHVRAIDLSLQLLESRE